MQTVRFILAHVLEKNEVSDLSSALIGLSGVRHVAVKAVDRALDVEYDPPYVNAVMMRSSIEGAGYPITDVGEIEP